MAILAAAKLSVSPELATFRLFGNNLYALVNFERDYLVSPKMLNLLWQTFYVNGPIFTGVDGQILNK